MHAVARAAARILVGGSMLAGLAAGAPISSKAPNPALTGLRFQNVSVSVADLARASAWYQDVLGFEEVRSGEFPSVGARFVFLEGHGVQLELIAAGRARVPETVTAPPRHLDGTGYTTLVFNTLNLTALTDYLGSRDVRIVWRERELADGLSSTMIHDVEGNLINIFGSTRK